MVPSQGQVYLSVALCSIKSSEESRVVMVDCTAFGLGHAHLSELCAIAWQQVRIPGRNPLSSTADGSHCTACQTRQDKLLKHQVAFKLFWILLLLFVIRAALPL